MAATGQSAVIDVGKLMGRAFRAVGEVGTWISAALVVTGDRAQPAPDLRDPSPTCPVRQTTWAAPSARRPTAYAIGLRRLAVRAVSVVAITLPVGMLSAGAAQAATTAPSRLTSSWTAVTLQNGWTNSPFGTSAAAVRTISGIVHLKGAIATTGSNPVPFTLPAAFRPAHAVFVAVDLCNATHGGLQVEPTGVVTVQAEGGAFSNAACFTSLDGVSFAKSASSFTALTLQNGWFNSPFGTSAPAARTISGITHLKGAIATSGSNPVPFTLPAAFRPASVVFVPVDLCTATNGRLQIEPTGVVSVQAEGGAFSNAACFTSLDGVSFAKSASSFTPLTLQNGWTNSPFGTSAAAVRTISGIVHFKGAIATTGSNPVPFTLPAAFRPASPVFVPVDLCNATNGRLQIEPTGVVTVQAEGGAFSNAACFTSLDGVSFAP